MTTKSSIISKSDLNNGEYITPGRILGASLLISLSSDENIREELSQPPGNTPYKVEPPQLYIPEEALSQRSYENTLKNKQSKSKNPRSKTPQYQSETSTQSANDPTIEGCNCKKSRCLKL